MDIRKTGQHTGDNRSPTLEKITKRRKEDRQRSSSSPDTRSQTDEKNVSAVPDPSIVPIEISGNLHKQGRLLKKWKPRFFQVQGNYLYYYRNYEKKECLGLIDLQKCYYIGKSTAASFGFAFELQTWGRTHLLAARDEREAEKWIQVIKKKMVPEARERGRRGTKEDVVAIIPDEVRTRRATIKLNRSGRKGGGVMPSSSIQEMSLSALKSLEEEDDAGGEGEQTKVTTSQSYPEFKTHQTNNTLVSDPSTNNASTVTSQTIQEDKIVRVPPPRDSSILPKQNMRSSPPPTSVIQSIADIPPPLNVLPVQTKNNTDTRTSSLLSQKLSPLNEETKELGSVQTAQPREIKKSPRKQVSVEDIVLPPPPSLVPIVKRSNTISDGCTPHVWPVPSALADLPPPIDGNYMFRNSPAQSKTKAARSNSTSAPSLRTTTEKQLQLQKNISNIELPPPFTMDLSLPPTLDLSLPPTLDQSLPPTGIDLASFPPPPSSIDLSSHFPPPIVSPEAAAASVIQEKKNNMATIDMQVLLNKIPPIDPTLDKLPSALDQLKYILSNDDNRQSTTIYSTKEYALLPEINKSWLSEETGIEQLCSFLQTVN